jgi:prepilin-type N-terminal cleavage/methylation domain-containing protein
MKEWAEIKRSQLNYCRGFTLLELIISVGILNIVLGVAYASISETTKWQSLGVIRRTIALKLQHSRFEAIRSHRPVTVSFEENGFFYDVAGTGTLRDDEFSFKEELTKKLIKWEELPQQFTFSGLGHVYQNGELILNPITLTIQLGTIKQTVIVNPFGSVSMEQGIK